MSETFRLSDYQIRIGKEDVIERHMHGILSDDPENTENQDKAKKVLGEVLKEMRVRFGTILKTGYFREIVPGIYGQMLDQLPALAPRSALVPGKCAQAPALAEMREAGPIPKSKNPLFYKSWTQGETKPDFEAVCEKWEGRRTDAGSSEEDVCENSRPGDNS